MPLNLLLVTVDTLRADHVGCYGGPATPAIDALAARGLVFEDATTTAPTTLPAHTSILSGQWVHVHGVDGNSDRAPATLSLVADRLAGAGYRTGAFVSGRPLARASGLAEHFQSYDDQLPDALGGNEFPAERRADRTVAAARRWLGDAQGPFFLWVHLYDPHLPYTPTAGSGYDAEIADVDRALGQLLGAVDPATTAVVFVADHGEGLGDHGEPTHGVFLYQATVRVPLVVAAPGVSPARRTEPVSAVDIAPTLLAMAGLPESLPGQDLRGPVPRERVLYALTVHGWERYGWAPLQAIRQGPRKAIDAPRDELYDLARDPAEAKNLAPGWFPGFPALPKGGGDALDPALAEQLVALGYAVAEPEPGGDAPDAKDRARFLPALEGGSAALHRGKPAEAERLLRPVVAGDPTNPAAHNDLGMALVRLGRPAEAAPILRRATELSPRDAMIWTNLGYAAAASGDLATARTAYSTAADLSPTFAAPCLNRAALEYRAGDLAAAKRWVDEALRRDPKLPEARALAAKITAPP
jgi:choline-sulfatase